MTTANAQFFLTLILFVHASFKIFSLYKDANIKVINASDEDQKALRDGHEDVSKNVMFQFSIWYVWIWLKLGFKLLIEQDCIYTGNKLQSHQFISRWVNN